MPHIITDCFCVPHGSYMRLVSSSLLNHTKILKLFSENKYYSQLCLLDALQSFKFCSNFLIKFSKQRVIKYFLFQHILRLQTGTENRKTMITLNHFRNVLINQVLIVSVIKLRQGFTIQVFQECICQSIFRSKAITFRCQERRTISYKGRID